MKKSTLIGGLAGGVVLFILGFLFYGMAKIPYAYYSDEMLAMDKGDNSDMIVLVIAHLLLGIILASIYSKWARGVHNFGQGFELGAWIGAFSGLGIGLIWYATTNYMDSMVGLAIEALYMIVACGIAGGVISLIFGKTETPA